MCVSYLSAVKRCIAYGNKMLFSMRIKHAIAETDGFHIETSDKLF